MTFRALPGFRDFAPEDLAVRAHIFGAWRRVAARYGFEEYDGPPLEPLELYTAKSGDEIVNQLYTFTDKGGREVALRPEMTPTLARMVAEHANGLKKPIRWFSIPQLFRYERQQRGRLREHFQLNCDLIGEAGPLADAELIALSIDLLRELGLTSTDFKVRLSDRRLLDGILAALAIAPDHRPLLMHALDKLGRSEYAARKQAFLDAAGSDRVSALELVEGLRQQRTWAALEAALAEYPAAIETGRSLQQTIAALTAMGLEDFIEVDLSIVRGIAYYTGTVFELFDAQRTLRAICGGGRYDTLLSNLGGVDLPALGFGMGDVVLGELLKERGLLPSAQSGIDIFVASVSPDDEPFVLAIVHQLRDAGLRAEYAFHASGLGKQLKVADARGAKLAVVVGPDDRARGEVQLKNLVAKTQVGVPLGALATTCRDHFSRNS
jgi:histidyl-tRNA synthetase